VAEKSLGNKSHFYYDLKQLGEQSPTTFPHFPLSHFSLIFTHTQFNMHYTKRLLSRANNWTIDHLLALGDKVF